VDVVRGDVAGFSLVGVIFSFFSGFFCSVFTAYVAYDITRSPLMQVFCD